MRKKGEFSFFSTRHITGCKIAIKNSLYRLKKFNNRVHFGAITSRHVIHFKRRWHKFVKGVLPQQGGHRVVSIGTQHTLTGLFYTNPCPIFQSIVKRMSSISYDVCIHGKLICPTFGIKKQTRELIFLSRQPCPTQEQRAINNKLFKPTFRVECPWDPLTLTKQFGIHPVLPYFH